MEGLRETCRVLMPVALVAAVLAVSSAPATACDAGFAQTVRIAGEAGQQKNRGTQAKCKRTPGARTAPKGCPEGGERLPNDDNKRSPLDDAPPLTPLVA